jgi:hypothetical protein
MPRIKIEPEFERYALKRKAQPAGSKGLDVHGPSIGRRRLELREASQPSETYDVLSQ